MPPSLTRCHVISIRTGVRSLQFVLITLLVTSLYKTQQFVAIATGSMVRSMDLQTMVSKLSALLKLKSTILGRYLTYSNESLGHLRHLEEMNFNGEYCLKFDYYVFGNTLARRSEMFIFAEYFDEGNVR